MQNKPKYKILLIEPSLIVRQGLAGVLESMENFSIRALPDLSRYRSGEEAIYDAIIINTAVVSYNQRADIRGLLDSGHSCAVLAISYSPYEEGVMHQYDGVIYIYDTEDVLGKKIVQAIEKVSQMPETESRELSAREKEILVAIAKGKSSKEIADEFHLSVYTVMTHRKNISAKLGINSISGLTVYAILNQMIDITGIS